MTIEEILIFLAAAPELTHRAMFGGYGLYSEGRIFSIVVDGEIYFKGDSQNIPDYIEVGGEQFVYFSAKGTSRMNYFRFPTEATLLEQLDSALSCAHRAPLPKKRMK